MSEELPAGSEPRRVELLGERFVAWRDDSGRVGLYDEACLHRGASMALARAEGDGLRCIYHGWKFAVDGTVLATPNVADERFRTRIQGRVRPVREEAGLLWTCLASKDDLPGGELPAFPLWPFMALPAEHRLLTRHVEDCNFVQVVEGLVDSSHLGLLHMNGLNAAAGTDLGYAQKIASMQSQLAPRQEVQDTEFGFYYAAMREFPGADGGAGHVEGRVAAFVAPCIVLNPNGDIASWIVPVSDTRTAFFHCFWSETQALGAEPLRSRQLQFVGLAPEALAAFGLTDDRIGRPGTPGPANRFHQDRAAMREGRSFSGLPGLIEEDVVVSVASGPVRPRTQEVLSAGDVGIARLYRCLLDCVAALEAGRPLPAQRAGLEWRSVVGAHGRLDGRPWTALVPPFRGRGDPVAKQETVDA